MSTEITVQFADGRVETVDGRVARMIEDLVDDRVMIENMLIGSVSHFVGKASIQYEIKLLHERTEAHPDPAVTPP